MPIQQLMLGSTPSAEAKYIDDVFNIYAYVGNGSSKSITNGVDLSGKGGLCWVKNRSSNENHWLFSNAMGVGNGMRTNSNGDKFGLGGNGMSSYNADGFTVGGSVGVNGNGNNMISWSFRNSKAFQTLTYEGTGSNQNIPHSLGSIPGMIIVKNIDASGDNWMVLHRSFGSGYYLQFNSTNQAQNTDIAEFWNNTEPTATQFTVGTNGHVNRNGETYVAYIFAGGESTAATATSVDMNTDGYLTVPGSSDFAFGTGAYTIECWIYYVSSTNFTSIFEGRPDGSNGAYMVIPIFDTGRIGLYKSATASSDWYIAPSDETALPKRQWTHVAIVREGTGSNQTKIYFNGKRVAQGTDDENYNENQGIRIGALHAYSVGDFVGKFSNYRVVKGTAVYTTDFKPPTEPLTNITNTKLLCCQGSSTTSATVIPTGSITATSSPVASTDSPFDDPAGFVFGEDQDTNIFKMGTYQGNGSAIGPEIYLGWEPQYVLIKRTDSAEMWMIFDSLRGITTPGNDQELYVQSSSLEYTNDRLRLTPTGFQPMVNNQYTNYDGGTFMYFCVRRSDGVVGKPIETGTNAMTIVNSTADSNGPTYATNFVVDFLMRRKPTGGTSDGSSSLNANMVAYHRLMGDQYLRATDTHAEATSSRSRWWFNTGANHTDVTAFVGWLWKRHAGFDVTTYKGDHVDDRKLPHSLGKTPEMIWTKNRGSTENWVVWHSGMPNSGDGENATAHSLLNLTNATAHAGLIYGGTGATMPTSTHYSVGTHETINDDNYNYVSILFASVEGVSKLGSYTSDNGAEVINLGFQARFLMVKRTDGTGNWKVFDSLRGMNVGLSGLDAALNINDTSDETDDTNWFYFSGTGNTTINMKDNLPDTNDGTNTYIYYAHA